MKRIYQIGPRQLVAGQFLNVALPGQGAHLLSDFEGWDLQSLKRVSMQPVITKCRNSN
jgi:hypothetical protein